MDINKGFICYWRIENFILFKKNSDIILSSPLFRACMLQSYFRIYVKTTEENFLGVFLQKEKNPPTSHRYCKYEVSLNYSISLLTYTGWIECVNNVARIFKIDHTPGSADNLINWKQLCEKKWKYLPSGCLTVKFQMHFRHTPNSSEQCLIVSRMLNEKELEHHLVETYYTLKQNDLLHFPTSYDFQKIIKTSKQSQTNLDDNCKLNNSGDILSLFEEDKLCFMILNTSDKEFMVNKSVLCTASPVFKKLMEKDVQNSSVRKLKIDDIDSETIKLLIRLLHLESLENASWDNAVKLFYAVDKYQIDILKRSCISLMANQLQEENICEAFILADNHKIDDLKQNALAYFIQNSKKILRSKEWKVFLSNHTELAADILHNSMDEFCKVQKT